MFAQKGSYLNDNKTDITVDKIRLAVILRYGGKSVIIRKNS